MASNSNADRAARIVADSRAYLAKPKTENLRSFETFVSTVLADAPLPKTRAEFVASVSGVAGLYSRYQDAKRADLLAEIGKVAKPKTSRAPKPTAPKSDATA